MLLFNYSFSDFRQTPSGDSQRSKNSAPTNMRILGINFGNKLLPRYCGSLDDQKKDKKFSKKKKDKKESDYDGVDQNFSQENIYMDVYMAMGSRTFLRTPKE
jgi:hypothetical protein